MEPGGKEAMVTQQVAQHLEPFRAPALGLMVVNLYLHSSHN